MSNSHHRRFNVEFHEDLCKGCGLCVHMCPHHVLVQSERLNRRGFHPAEYVGEGCTGCGICFHTCPEPSGIDVEPHSPTSA